MISNGAGRGDRPGSSAAGNRSRRSAAPPERDRRSVRPGHVLRSAGGVSPVRRRTSELWSLRTWSGPPGCGPGSPGRSAPASPERLGSPSGPGPVMLGPPSGSGGPDQLVEITARPLGRLLRGAFAVAPGYGVGGERRTTDTPRGGDFPWAVRACGACVGPTAAPVLAGRRRAVGGAQVVHPVARRASCTVGAVPMGCVSVVW